MLLGKLQAQLRVLRLKLIPEGIGEDFPGAGVDLGLTHEARNVTGGPHHGSGSRGTEGYNNNFSYGKHNLHSLLPCFSVLDV